MINNCEIRGNNATNNGKPMDLISPTGEVYMNIINATAFCSTIPEFSTCIKASANGLGRLRNNVRKSYLGWKLVKA